MNLKKRRNQNDLVKLEIIVITKAAINDGTITAFRPLVSAKNPHRCDDTIMPMKPIPLNIPLSRFDKFKSHSATGKMKLMLTVSRKTHPSIAPVKTIKA